MSCPRRKQFRMILTAVQMHFRKAFCTPLNIYDLCDQEWGEYGLSGCVSQGPDYSNITTVCDQNWGMYGLAGCVSYVPVQPDAFSNESLGLTPIGA